MLCGADVRRRATASGGYRENPAHRHRLAVNAHRLKLPLSDRISNRGVELWKRRYERKVSQCPFSKEKPRPHRRQNQPFPLFLLGAAIAGMGLLRRRRWAVALLRGLAPMVILYVVAYEVVGDPDWKWGTVALGCLVLAAFSLPLVYAGALRSSTARLSK